jgi:phage-related minor tail protein
MAIGVGDAVIPIWPDLSNFARELSRGVDRAMRRGGDVEVPVTADASGFRAALKKAASGGGGVAVDVDADVSGLKRDVARAIGSAGQSVDIEADVSGLKSDVARAIGSAGQSVDIEADVSGLRRDVERAIEQGASDADIGGDGIGGGGGGGGGGVGAGLAGGMAAKSGGAKAGLVGVGLAAGAGFMAGFSDALDREQIEDLIAASVEFSPSSIDADSLMGTATELYEGAWGDSLAEVADAVVITSRTIRDASEADIAELTSTAMDVGRVLQQPVSEVARVAQQMMDNGLVSSIGEAFDVMAAGGQSGLNTAGDLLETFAEYSVKFDELGLSAADVFGVLQTGMQMGARDTDVLADAYKELAIRSINGSTATVEAFEAIGLAPEEMARKFSAGGESARAAIGEVAAALSGTQDELVQNLAGTDLFGAKWEDVGGQVVIASAGAIGSIDGIDGAAQRLSDTLNGNTRTSFEAFKREALGGITEAIETKVLPSLLDLQNEFGEAGLSGAAELAGTKIREGLGSGFGWLVEDMPGVLGSALEGWGVFTSALTGGWTDSVAEWLVATALWEQDWQQSVIGMGESVAGFFSGIRTSAVGIWDGFWDALVDGFQDAWNSVASFINRTGAFTIDVPDILPGPSSYSVGLPNLPLLAAGGAVSSPMAAIIGDNTDGKPEIVSPVPTMREAMRAELANAPAIGDITVQVHTTDARAGTDVLWALRNLQYEMAR